MRHTGLEWFLMSAQVANVTQAVLLLRDAHETGWPAGIAIIPLALAWLVLAWCWGSIISERRARRREAQK